MVRRAPILPTLCVLLSWVIVGCNTGGSTAGLEGTIVARVSVISIIGIAAPER